MQAHLNFCFIAEAQYEDVKDECLKHITNGFTILHVMKAILEIAHGLMCALYKRALILDSL